MVSKSRTDTTTTMSLRYINTHSNNFILTSTKIDIITNISSLYYFFIKTRKEINIFSLDN